jgi:SpoVK/Ycf46/Vps4 family AAA+-type ATPase
MPSNAKGDWSRLVVSTEIAAALTQLEARCRSADNHDWRLQAKQTGVHALFSGPIGTGKTLAASILAARLGRALVRIDLSTVVSKYIGETEKNLQRVFETAARDDVVLLFDEADALFGKRTEVRDAHDRFANREVSFLLQAIENWHGLAVLASNAPQHIDPAFLRRMHAVITFPLPDAAERERIWRLHLPDGHALDDAWLGELAARCAYTGAQIRNVALAAALLATDAGQGALPREALEVAIRREYRQRGAPCPLD